MKIALYKAGTGSFAGGKLICNLIDQFSGRDGYAHVEFVFSDGVFFSSAPFEGVRFKRTEVIQNEWRFFDLDITSVEEEKLRRWCESKEGLEYDWMGVFGFVLPTHHAQDRWFCSEIIVAGLQQLEIFCHLDAWKISPNDLFLILTAIELTKWIEGHFEPAVSARHTIQARKCLDSKWRIHD